MKKRTKKSERPTFDHEGWPNWLPVFEEGHTEYPGCRTFLSQWFMGQAFIICIYIMEYIIFMGETSWEASTPNRRIYLANKLREILGYTEDCT